MPWNIDLVLMLRSIIGDLDSTSFTDERLKQILVVGAYNVLNDAIFSTEYTVNVAAISISPDPISENDVDFTTLTVYKSACILLGSEVKTNAGNAVAIKDGPSSIDLRGVAGSLTTLYNDICSKYDTLLKEYQYNRNNDTPIGQAILGPYSPGSMILNANQFDYRGNIFD